MRKTLRYSSFLLLIITMGMIFFLSSQTGDDSSSLSSGVTRFVLSIVVPGFRGMNDVDQVSLILKYHHLVRKLAHFSEYGAMGVFLCAFLQTYQDKVSLQKSGISILCCAFYAFTDEFHQGFVANRGPGIIDVLIDSSGALCGIVIVTVIAWLILKRGDKSPN